MKLNPQGFHLSLPVFALASLQHHITTQYILETFGKIVGLSVHCLNFKWIEISVCALNTNSPNIASRLYMIGPFLLHFFSFFPTGTKAVREFHHISAPKNSMTHCFSKIAQCWPTAVIRAPSWWVLLAHEVAIIIFITVTLRREEDFMGPCPSVWHSVCGPLGYIVITTWIQWKGLWLECVSLPLMSILCSCMCVCEQRHDLWLHIGLGLFREERHLCASQPKASCDPNCSPRTPAQLVVFFILIIFPSSLTFQLPYFVILWSPPAGNFCAGYDLKELANHTASLKLEQDVTKGPSLMVSTVWSACVHTGESYIYISFVILIFS